jgi:uncharacterized RDD family membrane protein YckC
MRFFNKVTLQTPESVELEFTLAGIGNRAYALLIDYLALSGILIAFLLLWIIFSTQLTDLIEILAGSNKRLWLWLYAILALLGFFIFVGYFVFFETIWQGQTPGKRYVKIRVIRDDGRPVGLQQATLRALLRPFDDFLFFAIGVFLIILNKKEKRLGDLAAGTLVIQEESAVLSATFPLSENTQTVANQLLTMANLSLLSPEDFAVIREYLQRRGKMTTEAKTELSKKFARQLKEKIDLEKAPSGVSADLFIEAVYLAYQQQSSTF